MEKKVKPLLLVDADPAGGLSSAIGENAVGTLAGVREKLIAAARNADDEKKLQLAQQVDYLLMEALLEKPDFSLISMGHGTGKGCYCPANALLRDAIGILSDQFKFVLIDAEAGLEQINRRVTRQATHTAIIIDGSRRSIDTMETLAGMIDMGHVFAVVNRVSPGYEPELPENVELAGRIPEDETLRDFDMEGRILWELPHDNAALESVRKISRTLGFLK